MTPEERAKKLSVDLWVNEGVTPMDDGVIKIMTEYFKQARSEGVDEGLEKAAKVAANMKIRLPLDENKPGEEPEFLKPMFSAAQFFQDQIAKQIRSLKGEG